MNVERGKLWTGEIAIGVILATVATQATAAVAVISETHEISAEVSTNKVLVTDSNMSGDSPATVLAAIDTTSTTVTTSWGLLVEGSTTFSYGGSRGKQNNYLRFRH